MARAATFLGTRTFLATGRQDMIVEMTQKLHIHQAGQVEGIRYVQHPLGRVLNIHTSHRVGS